MATVATAVAATFPLAVVAAGLAWRVQETAALKRASKETATAVDEQADGPEAQKAKLVTGSQKMAGLRTQR